MVDAKKQISKQQGVAHELRTAHRLVQLGATVAWPVGDNAPWDMICEWDGKVSRLQVKGTESMQSETYYVVRLQRGGRNRTSYTKLHTDFVIACTPVGLYVIPVEEIDRQRLVVWAGVRKGNRPHFDRYRDAWEVLQG